MPDGLHIDGSGNFWIGSTSNTFDTNANFYVQTNGTLHAESGDIGGIELGATFIQSSNYSTSGSGQGFRINSDGTAVFYGTVTGLNFLSPGDAAGDINSNSTTINGGKITAGTLSVTDADISGTLNFDKITQNSVNIIEGMLQNGAVTTDKLSDGSVTNVKIGSINASKITAGTMSADRISGGSINANIITGAGSLTGLNITADGIGVIGGISMNNSDITNAADVDVNSLTSSGSVSGTNGIFSGYVSGDEFRGNGSTVDIHRNGTSNGIRIVGASSGAYVFTYNSSGSSNTLYNPFSDERLKENITDLDYGLEEILQLRPITYDWKDDVRPFPENTELQYGLLAQEVEEVMPAIVDTAPSTHTVLDEEGNETEEDLGVMVDGTLIQNTKSYYERPLTYALIKAVQELSAKVDNLTDRIEALES